MEDQAAFLLATDIPTLTQVNSFSRQFWQPAVAMTRSSKTHYGVLCLGWPGVKPKTFQPGETICGRYRAWIHRGATSVDRLKQAYQDYEQAP